MLREIAHPQPCKIALLSIGTIARACAEAADAMAAGGLEVTHADMRFVKPLDLALLGRIAMSHDALITVEENACAGGFGAAVAEGLSVLGIQRRQVMIGVADQWVEHGATGELLKRIGLDAAGIQQAIRNVSEEILGHPQVAEFAE